MSPTDSQDRTWSDGAAPDPRLFAPATQRNRAPILEVLSRVLPGEGLLLEVASGSGEHAAWFAHQLRPLVWQPSDPDPVMRRSIAAHGTEVKSLKAPLDLDATRQPWPIAQVDAVVCINMIHIAPWAAAEGLIDMGQLGVGYEYMLHLALCDLAAGRLDDAAMRRLNFQVDEKKRDPSDVAREFLESHHLLERGEQ